MSRFIFTITCLLGAAAIVWIGTGFIGAHVLALAVTVLIGAVYAIGVIEMLQFRRVTTTLAKALAAIPANLTRLDDWLESIHPSLQNTVRLRIEGERVGLPGPALTPYLVGLLVMLGMLGTFLGMVATLNGAVFALEGTPDLQAIRSGLAAPIKGLGLAFGTSVAGVAASAMLGLMSTLSRRDRMLTAQRLDTKIATVLRGFSLVHHRQETFRALQMQAHALPDVVDKLQAMAVHMERMSSHLNERLANNQESFHTTVNSMFAGLAQSVEKSLKESLTESGRLAGESMKPIVEDAMAGIIRESQSLHATLINVAQTQLDRFSRHFSETASDVANTWREGLATHAHCNEKLVNGLGNALDTFNVTFERTSTALLSAFNEEASTRFADQAASNQQRLDQWMSAMASLSTTLTSAWRQSGEQLHSQQQALCAALAATAQDITANAQSSVTLINNEVSKLLADQTAQDQTRREQWVGTLESMATSLHREWQRSGELTLSQQQKICTVLEATALEITGQAQASSSQMLSEIAQLLNTSDALISARMTTEETWLTAHGERMDQLARGLRTELSQLRDEEALRGKAAVDHLAGLQTALAIHLTTLGTALEAPITRLIQTASEAPRAAAEVIGQLRQEISDNIVRDNALLEERSHIMQGLDALLKSLNKSSAEQRAAIETLVQTSADRLTSVGTQFTDKVSEETSKLADIAAQVTGGAVEVSSLSEAFGFAVQLFSDANDKLIENLHRLEASLEKSTARSDEQLAYYVAQAREIIDLSTMSQREIFEELRQLSARKNIATPEVR